VTEDGLRVYNIQLCIFLFVTSKSKETLWLCVLVTRAARSREEHLLFFCVLLSHLESF
jgi:hypothetical protein